VTAVPARGRRRFPRPGDPSYDTALRRVRAQRGPARAQTCECGAAAVAWSYDGSDPREFTDRATGRRYTADVQRYQPLCAADLRRAGWTARRRGRAALDVRVAVRLYADGCSAAGIGRRFGYSAADVVAALRGAGVAQRASRTSSSASRSSDQHRRTHQ
jgi:hypothetical protein